MTSRALLNAGASGHARVGALLEHSNIRRYKSTSARRRTLTTARSRTRFCDLGRMCARLHICACAHGYA
eukprot:6175120-Pleurochrysis_carterae.AAC.3